MFPQNLCEFLGRHGRNALDAVEGHPPISHERKFKPVPVELRFEPLVDRSSLSDIVRPARRNQPDLSGGIERHPPMRMKHGGIDGISDDHRLHRLIGHLGDPLIGPGGLQHGRRREPFVQLEAELIFVPVESSNQMDRSVNPVNRAQPVSLSEF